MTTDIDIEAARKLFARECVFVAGAPDAAALPDSKLPEIAFVGRSNVGKSSLINALVRRSRLARVSNTPGRTRMINLFRLDDVLMLADLPGYGYAKVSRVEAEQWQREIVDYLHSRPSLRRVILLIDARRGIMDSDRQVMGILDKAGVAYALTLTKVDKLRAKHSAPLMSELAAELRTHAAALPQMYSTSAQTGAGLDALKAGLAALAGA